jgi:protein-disulfide isomerase
MRALEDGRRLLASGQYDAAIAQFEAALEADKGLAEAHWHTAVAYERLIRAATANASQAEAQSSQTQQIARMQVEVWQQLRAISCRLYLLSQPNYSISSEAKRSCAEAAQVAKPAQPAVTSPNNFDEPLTQAQQQQLSALLARARRIHVPVDGGGAAVLLIKFNDFMCPPCAATHAEYKPVLETWQRLYPGSVKLLTFDYPLEPECNRYAANGTHLAACEAAVASRLARERGKGDAMDGWLFLNLSTLTASSVRASARLVGGVTDFDGRYSQTLAQVRADVEFAAGLKDESGEGLVKGTPTFVLNGVVLPGMRGKFLNAIIELELRKAGLRR